MRSQMEVDLNTAWVYKEIICLDYQVTSFLDEISAVKLI